MSLSSTALAIFLFSTSLAAAAYADDAAEKAEVERVLKQSAKDFLAAIDGVNEQQWDFKGAGIRHSIGEEAEHVCFAEQELQRVIQNALRSDADATRAAALKGKKKTVRELMLEAAKGAENYRARGRINSRLEVLEYFEVAHNKLLQLLAGSEGLSTHIFKHPNKDYGELTALQWFYYVAYHKLRHVKQIEVIKGHPDYPGRVRKATFEPSGSAPGHGVSPARGPALLVDGE